MRRGSRGEPRRGVARVEERKNRADRGEDQRREEEEEEETGEEERVEWSQHGSDGILALMTVSVCMCMPC